VGLEAVRGVKTVKQIAQAFGVHPAQVGQWKREIQDQAKTLFEGARGFRPAKRDHSHQRISAQWVLWLGSAKISTTRLMRSR
jgi:transposase